MDIMMFFSECLHTWYVCMKDFMSYITK